MNIVSSHLQGDKDQNYSVLIVLDKFTDLWRKMHYMEKPIEPVLSKWFGLLKSTLPADEARYLTANISHQVAIAPMTGRDRLWRTALEHMVKTKLGKFLFVSKSPRVS